MTRSFLLTALLLLSTPQLNAQALPPKARVAQVVDSLAQDFVRRSESPSVAIGLVRGRDTLVLKAWGQADIEQNVPATANTVYRIGSVTKQFTAAAVMQLVEQKKLTLDDSIGTYLSGLPAAWRGVKIRQLLNHTSGIPSYTSLGEKWERRWGEEMTPDTLVALTASDTMWFAPGTRWAYDNTGYILLGMLIEKLTGHSWSADITQRFITPLGLHDTRECLTGPIISRRAHGYQREQDHWENAPYIAMSQPYSAGSMCSTVGDLARWNRALHTGRVVSAASYTLMTTPEGVAATNQPRYGFALIADSIAGRPFITHGGGIHGFVTANAWVPDVQLSITVLTNSGTARETNGLMRNIVEAALGAPLEPRH